MGLRGVLQLATFHPAYEFSTALPDDPEVLTLRVRLPRALLALPLPPSLPSPSSLDTEVLSCCVSRRPSPTMASRFIFKHLEFRF